MMVKWVTDFSWVLRRRKKFYYTELSLMRSPAEKAAQA